MNIMLYCTYKRFLFLELDPEADCGAPEDAGNKMSRDWSDVDDGTKEKAEAV